MEKWKEKVGRRKGKMVNACKRYRENKKKRDPTQAFNKMCNYGRGRRRGEKNEEKY